MRTELMPVLADLACPPTLATGSRPDIDPFVAVALQEATARMWRQTTKTHQWTRQASLGRSHRKQLEPPFFDLNQTIAANPCSPLQFIDDHVMRLLPSGPRWTAARHHSSVGAILALLRRRRRHNARWTNSSFYPVAMSVTSTHEDTNVKRQPLKSEDKVRECNVVFSNLDRT